MKKKLSAVAQLQIERQAAKLLPRLVAFGLSLDQAIPIASHTVMMFYSLKHPPKSPWHLLEDYSLEEIAQFAEGQKTSEEEWGFNKSFSQEVPE